MHVLLIIVLFTAVMSADEEMQEENEAFETEDTMVIQIQDSGVDEAAQNTPVTLNRQNRAAARDLQRNWARSSCENSEIPEFMNEDSFEPFELHSPLHYFLQFFDTAIFNIIVEQSNLYALQKDINKPLNLDHQELKKWIGLVICFSISKLPNTRMHWAKNLSPINEFAADYMSRDRFEFIKSNLHFADNREAVASGNSKTDPMYKVRPLIDLLRANFQSVPKEQYLCVDEQMVPYKGRSRVKQFIPNKPKRFGFKLFVLASNKGFMHDFIPYVGKILPVEDAEVPDIGASSNIVLHLAQNIPSDKNYLLFFDNWFTSLPLLQHLASRAIWCCGTVRLPRLKGLPISMKDDKKLARDGKGSYQESELGVDNSKVTLVRWFDNKVVNLVSTFAKANPLTTVKRFDKTIKKTVEVPCPDIVQRYNKSMGGVDLADQLISLYRINIKSKKAYHRLVFHFLDMSIVNAWIMYRKDCDNLSIPKKDVLQLAPFKLNVAVSLMKAGQVCQSVKRGRPSKEPSPKAKKPRNCGTPPDEVRLDNMAHGPLVAAKRQRCRAKKCPGQTKIYCKKCNVHLCLDIHKNCFASFHNY